MVFIKLNQRQTNRISEIFGNLGLLFFASLVLPFFVKSSDFDAMVFIGGILALSICFFESIILIGGDDND